MLMQKHLKLMNSKEWNLAKKKKMFSFPGIMAFYKMSAATLFILQFSFFAILKKGNNSIFQFQEKILSYSPWPLQIFQWEKKSPAWETEDIFFLPFSHYEWQIPIQQNSPRFLVYNNGHTLSVIIDYIHTIILFHLYPSTIHICIMISCTE